MFKNIKQIRITLMTMFKVNPGPPNEVRQSVGPMQRRGTRGSVCFFILRVASWLVLCALKVRLLPKLIIAMNSAVDFPAELTLAGHHA